jgi:quinohemoprotein ethanol dehydrogenase
MYITGHARMSQLKPMPAITLDVNGGIHTLEGGPSTPLLWVLRDHLRLIGTNRLRTLALCVLLTRLAYASTPQSAVAAGADWTSHNGSWAEAAYSTLQTINATNVQKLGLQWSLDLPGESSLEATPLAVDGVLYFTGSYAAVYAVDAVSGKLLWRFDPETWKVAPAKLGLSLPVNRGAAFAAGRIFFASRDGRLIALEAKNGKMLWSVDTLLPAPGMKSSTGAPRVFKDKVIIGNGGADVGERGYVTAYEASTGRQVWRFYVTPGKPDENKGDPAMERAAATWHGEYWKTGTGGAVWDSMTFDAELNRIYLGTGNGGPYDIDKRSPGGGDNLYVASIIALDADTGKYLWHYQVTPRDCWDYDAPQQMILADLNIGGKQRKVLMQAPKDGFFYVLDRGTGKLISAEKFGKVTWAERIDMKTGRPVESATARYGGGDALVWPGTGGAHAWQSMSFSPRTGLVYVPYMQMGARFHKGQPVPGMVTFGGVSIGEVESDPQDGKGALLAWDPVRQQARWRVPLETIWNGGTLATAGDLVFQGTADGYFSAYDASTGQRLWHFNAGLGIIAAPITFATAGTQYVSVLVGYGASAAIGGKPMQAGWKYGAQPRRLLTLTLDGKAALPPTAATEMSVKALDNPSIQLDPVQVGTGQMIYNLACAVCHGLNLNATGGPGPDLRESAIALTQDGLWSVVHEGSLISRGMPRFEALQREQLGQIYAYIRAGARQALADNKQQSGTRR